jgi:hypothetical protein
MAVPDKKDISNVGKKFDRGFFKFFNDKSRLKAAILSTSMAVVPAMYITDAMEKIPSHTRHGENAQQHVDAYLQEINEIKASLPVETISPQQLEKFTQARQKAADLTTRITFDRQISEYDVSRIAISYTTHLGASIPMEAFQTLRSSSSYLEEVREQVEKNGIKPSPEAAQDLQAWTARERVNEALLIGIGAYMGLFLLFDAVAKNALARGSRRNDRHRGEERKEKFDRAKNDLESILKPSPTSSTPKRER